MSLVSNLTNLVIRIGTEFKSIRTLISGTGTGGVGALTTTSTNLVDAINEIKASSGVSSVNGVSGPGAVVLTTGNIAEGSNLYYTSARTLATAIAGFSSTPGSISASDSVLSAINKLAGNTLVINDTAASDSTVFSSNKTSAAISVAVASLVSSSPAALDTLNELAAALGNDPQFATTIATSISIKANTTDVFTRTQLGNDADNHNFVNDFQAALV